MRILLHYPAWGNRWEPYIKEALNEFDLTITHTEDSAELGELSLEADVLISMWASGIVEFWSKYFSDKKIVTYLRRFELWQPEFMTKIDWTKVDRTIFVSNWCRQAANMMWNSHHIKRPKEQIIIPNGVDFSDFELRQKKPDTKKIAFVCSLKEVKNVPLAFQILMELPKDYTLHHIGLPFSSQHTGQLYSYMHGLGLTDRFFSDGHIPREKVADWLADKDYILSTSLNEGNPNNVIEAMAMGIKPVIHSWPGAREQFPEDLIFDRVSGAVDLITGESYTPVSYRNWVLDRYNLSNFEKFKKVVEQLAEDQ